MYHNFPISVEQQQELWDFAARQQIVTQNRLVEHHFQNQMDLAKMEEAEKQRSDIRKEREYQQTYAAKGQGGQLILIGEKFHERMVKELPVREITAKRLKPEKSQGQSVILISFLFGIGRDAREAVLYLDEKRIGEQQYINRAFARSGVGFRMKKVAEETIRRLLIGLAQEEAEDITLPEIPGWYHTPNGWEYSFPGNLCWKEVIRWAL